MSAEEGHAYARGHRLSGKVLLFELNTHGEAVLSEARQARAGRAARTLVKDGPLRLTIVGFKSGASLRDHHAGGPVSIHVLSGVVEVNVGEQSEQLEAHSLLTLEPSVIHSLIAISDALILLTIVL